MGWTKEQLVRKAYAEIGLGTQFNIGAAEIEDGLSSLDSMMATWNAKGIRLGYALPASPDDSDAGDDSGLADSANEAVYLNLALRLAPGVGKQVALETKLAAKQAYDVLAAIAAFPPQQFSRVLPAGAGNKPSRTGRPFLPADPDPLEAAEGNDVIELD